MTNRYLGPDELRGELKRLKKVERDLLDTRRKAREALVTLESAGCDFQFCPGPDHRFTPMATCQTCRSIQLLRRALK